MTEAALSLNRIMYPVQPGAAARTARTEALYLAHRYASELVVLRVMDESGPESGSAPASRDDTGLEEECRERLAELTGEDPGEVRIRAHTVTGEVSASVIVATMRDRKVDLVVMATRGRRGLRRLFLGSLAEDVVREAPCPVLTVRMSEPATGEAPSRWSDGIQRIVVPVDFSPRAAVALSFAKKLAADLGARLDVLHVVGSVMKATRTGTRSQLRAQVLETDGPEVAFRVHVEAGFAPTRIGEFARERRSDLIVLASHGRSGPTRVLFGSVTERVIRSAPCPVLTVKIAAPVEPGGNDRTRAELR